MTEWEEAVGGKNKKGIPLCGLETRGKRPDSTRYAASYSYTIHTKDEAWKEATTFWKMDSDEVPQTVIYIPTDFICRFPQGVQIHSNVHIIFLKIWFTTKSDFPKTDLVYFSFILATMLLLPDIITNTITAVITLYLIHLWLDTENTFILLMQIFINKTKVEIWYA